MLRSMTMPTPPLLPYLYKLAQRRNREGEISPTSACYSAMVFGNSRCRDSATALGYVAVLCSGSLHGSHCRSCLQVISLVFSIESSGIIKAIRQCSRRCRSIEASLMLISASSKGSLRDE
nr:hypothetical protein CFP56_43708 [Quercus suber]